MRAGVLVGHSRGFAAGARGVERRAAAAGLADWAAAAIELQRAVPTVIAEAGRRPDQGRRDARAVGRIHRVNNAAGAFRIAIHTAVPPKIALELRAVREPADPDDFAVAAVVVGVGAAAVGDAPIDEG